MSQSVRFILGLFVVSQLFFACKKEEEQVIPNKEEEPVIPKEEPVIPASSQPGFFVISSIEQSSVANGRKSAETYNSEFDLGPLMASDRYLFMIANGGDEPIFNVALTSDNTPFEISPKTIQVVPGKKGSAIIPLLTVGITHGVKLRGVGTAPLLAIGLNKATIRMTGKTLSGTDTVEVSGEFIVKVDAKVMDAKILSAEIAPVLGSNWYYSTPALIVEPSKIVKLVNTGNVPIHAIMEYDKYEFYGTDTYPIKFLKIKNEIDLQPDETKDISSLIAPISGKRMEGDTNFEYNGRTTITLTTQEAVSNINGFVLYSK